MKTKEYPTIYQKGPGWDIELIPYRENINPISHVLCCGVSEDISDDRQRIFDQLRSEGWKIKFVIPNTLNNIARTMCTPNCFSEKTVSDLGIWNLFVPFKVFDRYLSMLKRSGLDESEYQVG